jgi:hypothetical protein
MIDIMGGLINKKHIPLMQAVVITPRSENVTAGALQEGGGGGGGWGLAKTFCLGFEKI